MSDWNQWRVIITATQAEALVVRTDDEGAPVVGPSGEPIDTAKSRVISRRRQKEMTIKEMDIPTGKNYQLRSIKVVAPADQVSDHITTWPVPVNIVSASTLLKATMEGDVISWLIGLNTTAGALTAAASISDTVITVSQTVIDNMDLLYRVRLALATDPTNTYEDVGKIVSCDPVALTITVDTALTQAWAAGTTLVQLTSVYVDGAELGNMDWVVEMGKDKIGASYLPAGTELTCRYDNKHATNVKTMYVYIAYMYGMPD